MKKRLMGLVLLGLLTTGCSIEYNLTIDAENNFTENFQVQVYISNDLTLNDLYYFYTEEYPIYEDEEFMYYDPLSQNEDYTYYDKSYQAIENGYIFNYQAEFSYENYIRARSINTVFNNFSVGYLEDENSYYLAVSNTNLFANNANLDEIIVNITFSEATVLSHNADTVNANTYTWVFTSDDYSKNINIRYQLETTEEEDPSEEGGENSSDDTSSEVEEELNNSNFLDYILLGAVLLIFGVAIIGIIKYKSASGRE